MAIKYKMPCFDTHRHLLAEDPEGYIVEASDYDAVVKENNFLKNQVKSLTAQLEEAYSSAKPTAKKSKKKTSTPVRYIVKTQMDENDWITMSDLKTGSVLYFDTIEEAEANGRILGPYKIEEVK